VIAVILSSHCKGRKWTEGIDRTCVQVACGRGLIHLQWEMLWLLCAWAPFWQEESMLSTKVQVVTECFKLGIGSFVIYASAFCGGVQTWHLLQLLVYHFHCKEKWKCLMSITASNTFSLTFLHHYLHSQLHHLHSQLLHHSQHHHLHSQHHQHHSQLHHHSVRHHHHFHCLHLLPPPQSQTHHHFPGRKSHLNHHLAVEDPWSFCHTIHWIQLQFSESLLHPINNFTYLGSKEGA